MQENNLERKKLIKGIIISVIILCVVISVIRYAIYLRSYHEYGRDTSVLFGPPDEYGVTNPDYVEEEIDVETGLVTHVYEGSTNVYCEKAVMIIKGKLTMGSFRYILSGDNDRIIFEKNFESGVYYDEEIVLNDVGCTLNETLIFLPETRALGEGISFEIIYYTTGYVREFGH